jgi:hypothetical protein
MTSDWFRHQVRRQDVSYRYPRAMVRVWTESQLGAAVLTGFLHRESQHLHVTWKSKWNMPGALINSADGNCAFKINVLIFFSSLSFTLETCHVWFKQLLNVVRSFEIVRIVNFSVENPSGSWHTPLTDLVHTKNNEYITHPTNGATGKNIS